MDYYKKYIKYKKKYINLKVNGGFITNIIPMNNKQIFKIKNDIINLKDNIVNYDQKKITPEEIYNFLIKINKINDNINIWNLNNNEKFIVVYDDLDINQFSHELSKLNRNKIINTLQRILESVKMAKNGTKTFPSLDEEIMLASNKI
jgi:hypothetical protein